MGDSVRDSPAADAHDIARSWYVLGILVAGYAIYNLDKTITSVLIEPIKHEFRLSDSAISLLAGVAMTIPFALTCIPMGILADRINRTRFLAVLVLGWSVMTGVTGLAAGVAMLFVARAGVGALQAGYTPVVMSILSDSFPRRLRPTAMGIFGLGSPVGVFLGMAGGGYIAAMHGWRAAFFAAGLPGAVIAALVALSVREPARGTYDAAQDAFAPSSVRDVLANMMNDRALFHVAAGMILCVVLPGALAIWTPSFLIRVQGMPLRQAGLYSAVLLGACGASGSIAGGIIADRVGRHQEWRKLSVGIIGGLIGIAAVLPALLLVDGRPAMLALLGLGAFCCQTFIGTTYAFVASLSPPCMRGTTMSIQLVVINLLSFGVASMAVGLMSDLVHPVAGTRSIAVGMAATCAFSAAGIWHFWRAQTLLRQSPAS